MAKGGEAPAPTPFYRATDGATFQVQEESGSFDSSPGEEDVKQEEPRQSEEEGQQRKGCAAAAANDDDEAGDNRHHCANRVTRRQQQRDQTQQEEEEKKKKKQPLNLSLRDFFDTTKPWVLVPNGSLNGHFDFVPEHLRVGPWSIHATVYLLTLACLTTLAGCYFFSSASAAAGGGGGARSTASSFQDLEYPQPRSIQCLYNAAACLWMTYVMYLIVKGPLGLMAWGTYTIQSWTLLTVRHGLCALACTVRSPLIVAAAEYARFPAACSSTITFVVWNFAIAPFIYLFGMKTEKARQGFLQFNFSFRLVQIHVFNIVFSVLNQLSCPKRILNSFDLYLSVLSVVLYMLWYFLVLDRFGVHLYPIFSPRTKGLVVLSWTVVLTLYLATFFAWRHILWPTTATDDGSLIYDENAAAATATATGIEL